MTEQSLSTQEAADELGFSRSTIWAWITNGYLGASRQRRRWRVPRSEVEAMRAWLSSGCQPYERNWDGSPGPSVLGERYAWRKTYEDDPE